MRRLVCEFYEGFNFGKFVRKHPDLKGHITDMLIGDLFNDRVDAIVAPWQRDRPGFPNYAAGSWGPASSDELLHADGRSWRRH